jgi:CubicO group peptidase (beta-lactamase class C family)
MRSPAVSLLALAAACGGGPRVAPWPTEGWAVAAPDSQGLDPAPLRTLHERMAAGRYGNVDRFLVVRDGFLVLDEGYPHDYREVSRGQRSAVGCGWEACRDSSAIHEFNYLHPEFHPWYRGSDLHTLQSVTKSVAATVLGIAIGRGDVSGVEAPLLSFLTAYDLSRVDPRLHRATLADLLTMRLGIEWHETDRPLDSTNTTARLEWSADWVQFTLDQPMDAAPGTTWVYNSGGSHLLSAVVRRATETTIDAYAEEHLFDPLGITAYHWKREPRGLPDAEGGLYLDAADLAKLGYLYLHDGMWDGARILPEGWVDSATARRVNGVGNASWGYGYQWWRPDRGDTVVWAALGFGGQLLLVLPQHDLVAVVNAWNVFGRPARNLLDPVLDALLAAARGAG